MEIIIVGILAGAATAAAVKAAQAMRPAPIPVKKK